MSGKHIYAEAVIVLTPPPRKKILFFIQVPQKQDVQQVQGPCEAMYHKMLIPTCWGWRQGQGGRGARNMTGAVRTWDPYNGGYGVSIS